MDNFLYHIPTKIHFGRGKVSELPGEVQVYGCLLYTSFSMAG